MNVWSPEKIFLEAGCETHPVVRDILAKVGDIPLEAVPGPGYLVERMQLHEDPIATGKKWLFLSRRKGPFIKACPCTPQYVHCGYFIINLDLNCPLDCSYCILQHYLDPPLVTVHVNRENLRPELDRFLSRGRRGFLRIGTGELGDSLALDHLTGSARFLIDYFRDKPGVFLEIKTKTTNVHNILEIDAAQNIVIAWSLNADVPAKREERGTPEVQERLSAAEKVSKTGFPVGFHFDPLVDFTGWEEGYEDIIRRLFLSVRPERIAWISLGSLRFHPSLKAIIRNRFPGSAITGQEFIKGIDGKLRYFRPLRVKMYKLMVSWIRRYGGDAIPIYLCMESRQIWDDVLKKNNEGRKLSGVSFPRPVFEKESSCLWE